jgi:hypothetical protein
MKAHLACLLLCTALFRGQGNRPPKIQICPAMFVLSQQTSNGPDSTLTTVVPAVLEGRQVWRVTDYSVDPTLTNTNDYDLYDIDRVTLAPLRNVYNVGGTHLEVHFSEKEITVQRAPQSASALEKFAVDGPVAPEGPGSRVFVASLPLHVAYRTRYRIVDRWDGQGSTRLKNMTLSVLRRETEDTALGKKEVYILQIEPDDGSFHIKEHALVTSPHWAIKTEYVRGKLNVMSEVTSLASSCN